MVGSIKEATIDDFPEILRMVKAMRDELGQDCKESYVVNTILQSLKLAPCFLLEKDGKICGMAGLTVFFDGFTGQATLSEYGFYIDPSQREYSAFSGLIDKCKEYANKVNMPLMLTFQSQSSDDFKIKLFKRKGFRVDGIVGEYNGKK